MALPTAEQLRGIYNEFHKNLKVIANKLPKFEPGLPPAQMLNKLGKGRQITQAECKEALRLLGAMDCLYDFGLLNSVQFLYPMEKDLQEKTEDAIENIFAARRLHRRDRADGLVVAGDAVKQGYNELLPHLKKEFEGAQFPTPMKVGHEAEKRRKKRKGKR